MKMVKLLKSISIILISYFLLTSSSCNRVDCAKQGYIILIGIGGSCDILISVEGILYEPTNILDYQYAITYKDSQKVDLDYQLLGNSSLCGASDQIEIFCLQ